MIGNFLRKNREAVMYVFVGVLTTAVNMAAYYMLFNLLKTANVPATVLAKIISTLFAFITNKLWVFQSRSGGWKTILREFLTFFGFRFVTLLLDVLIMFLAVDILRFDSTLSKLASNVIIIIVNFFASKFIVFKKRSS